MSLGQLLTAPGSSSSCSYRYSTNSSSATTQSDNIFQREGFGTTAALKLYSVVAGTATQVAQLSDAAVFNVSLNGAANTGAITTGNISSVGILHSVSTQRFFSAGGYIAAKDTGTNDSSGDSLEGASLSPGVWGLLRYSQAGGWQQSISTDGSAHRIWTAFGGAASSGAANTIQLSNGSGGLTSATGFMFDPTAKTMSIPGIGSAPAAPASGVAGIYADATGQPFWYDHAASTWTLFGTGGGGVVTSITGTTNQIVRSSPTGGVTLSLAANLTTASFVSTSTTSAVAFQNGSGSFSIDGIGNISTPGVLHTAGATSGVNVTGASTNAQSIQTDGGITALQVVATQATFGLNTFAPVSPLTVVSQTSSFRGIASDQYSTDGVPSLIQMRKARGTAAAPTIVTVGDVLGNIAAAGYDGSAFTGGARARFMVDAAVSTGILPTSFEIDTGTSGGGITRMTISSAGLTTFTGTVAAPLFNSSATGTALAFQSGSGLFSVLGNGAVSAASLTTTGNIISSGAANFTSYLLGGSTLVNSSGGVFCNSLTSNGSVSVTGNVTATGAANFTSYLLAGTTVIGSGGAISCNGITSNGSINGTGLAISISGALLADFTGQGTTVSVECFSSSAFLGTQSNVPFTLIANNTGYLTIGTTGLITSVGNIASPLFNSSATGTSLAFQAGSGAFQVNGNGAISGTSVSISGNATSANVGVSNQLIMTGQGSAPSGPSSGQFSFYGNTTTGINYWNGSGWVALGTATGVTSLGGAAGALTLSSGLTMVGAVLTIGQPVGTSSNVTFASVTGSGFSVGGGLVIDNSRNITCGSGTIGCGAMSTGSIGVTGNVNATGSANFTSYLLSGSTLVNSTGGISCNGITTSNGITISSGGVTASAAANFNSYEVSGVTVITSGRLVQCAGVSFGASGLIGSGSISASGNIAGNVINGLSFTLNGTTFLNSGGQGFFNGITSNGGVQATGFNTPSGSGQTWTINIPGGFTISGVGGTFHNLIYSGGSLISAS